ncbi:winged helix DNA-binding domain-containing protein [Metschnikowia bicuspidata]|uniref:Winged helix DNA-binding domain-containing protein n=1 Tax=Metschnikowia bicuspidata TaxID=27322 RepID=A0A4P9Z6P6_9ASCO|nr:winged helix DNA-binding domain-containing protein [Metschnikowia bicuspidata]
MPYAAPIPIHIPPPLSPKQNPQQALTQQIDYYFSLENLIRDLYLRKNMETEGWVDLDLILNFKRVEIIINGLRNSIDDPNEKSKEKKLDKAIVQAVQDCINLEIGYLNGKENYNAMTREIQLRVKHNFEQWLLPDNL